jgi:hypothetical protein
MAWVQLASAPRCFLTDVPRRGRVPSQPLPINFRLKQISDDARMRVCRYVQVAQNLSRIILTKFHGNFTIPDLLRDSSAEAASTISGARYAPSQALRRCLRYRSFLRSPCPRQMREGCPYRASTGMWYCGTGTRSSAARALHIPLPDYPVLGVTSVTEHPSCTGLVNMMPSPRPTGTYALN